MRARIISAGVALLLILAAVAGTVAATASGPVTPARSGRGDSGIAGRVVYGPVCPVQRIDRLCSRPYAATMSILVRPANRLVARVRSSPLGWFRLPLVPGRYRLVPEVGRPYPRASPQTFTVHRHHYVQVTVSYNSGIR